MPGSMANIFLYIAGETEMNFAHTYVIKIYAGLPKLFFDVTKIQLKGLSWGGRSNNRNNGDNWRI